jgi:predicted enzyme related to lactoylglutathione lyase
MANPVSWFEIIGKDGDALQKFYADLFGWQMQKAPGDMNYAMLEAKDGGIAGGIGESQQGMSYVAVYAEVDDPQAYLDKAESLGGTTVMPVTEVPGMVTFALFNDPEGHTIGVYKGMGQS